MGGSRDGARVAKVEIVQAFLPESGNGGNRAGVVVDAAGLADAEMQRIAAAVGASETAFVLPSTRAAVKLRFFTPKTEVPLCGHATLAAFHALALAGRFGAEDGIRRLNAETAVGVLAVDVAFEEGQPQRVTLTQGRPETVAPRLMVGEVAPHLGIERARIEKAGAPIQIVSTGMNTLIVPVDTRETLAAVKPGPGLAALLTAKKAHTILLWTKTQGRPQIRVSQRVFAPHIGIDEDAATGTSTAALGAYLLSNHLVEGHAPVTAIRCEQGVEAGSPSFLVCDVHVDPVMNGFRPTKVKVGGKCRTTGTIDA